MNEPACYKAFGRDFYIEPASVQTANAVFQDEYHILPLRQHNVRTIVDVGAHVGSFTVLCHEYWPEARIVAVEPHPDSFELLQRNTGHIPEDQVLLINAAIGMSDGKSLLASPVSHSRVGEYLGNIWNHLEPRPDHFGIEVNAITPSQLWQSIQDFGIDFVDLMKLDCEGAEYFVTPSWAALSILPNLGWIRGEWHSRAHNPLLEEALVTAVSPGRMTRGGRSTKLPSRTWPATLRPTPIRSTALVSIAAAASPA
jgi:FkbM family methyltransferase